MTERWQTKLSLLRDVEPPEWPLEPQGQRHEQRRVSLPAPVLVAALLAVAIVVGGSIVRFASDEPNKLADLSAPGPIGGEYATLEEALKIAPFQIYRPQDPLASDATAERVWVAASDDAPAVQLQYASGLTVVLTRWPTGKDPEASYERQWQESGQQGTLTTINGHHAWIVPGTDEISSIQLPDGSIEGSGVVDPNVNVVELTIDRIDIVVRGSHSVDELLRVASSIEG